MEACARLEAPAVVLGEPDIRGHYSTRSPEHACTRVQRLLAPHEYWSCPGVDQDVARFMQWGRDTDILCRLQGESQVM